MNMKTRLVRIGNSRGLHLPKSLIEKAGLKDEVEVTLLDGVLIVTSAEHPRQGWEAAVSRLLERRDDHVFEESVAPRFDSDWER